MQGKNNFMIHYIGSYLQNQDLRAVKKAMKVYIIAVNNA